MIEFRVRDLALKHGITSSYGLGKLMNLPPSTAVRLWKAEEKRSLEVQTIDAICEAFNCLPGDFIIYTPNKKASKKV